MVGQSTHSEIATLSECIQRVRAAGLGTTMVVVGELLDEPPQEGRPTRILIPVDSGQGGFASVKVMVDSVTGAVELRRSSHVPGHPSAPASLQGRHVTVRGRVDVDRTGVLVLKGAALDVATAPGPYSVWREAQAANTGLTTAVVPRAKADDLVTYLRGQPEAKRIVWLGRDTTRAYQDLHRSHSGLIAAMDVAGAAMSGPNAVDEMCAALAAVDVGRTSLVILARGGGDLADLALFDDARLLRAVIDCPVPTACAIGHHQDRPLVENACDWALSVPSDLRKVLYPAVTGARTAQEERTRHADRTLQAEQRRRDDRRRSDEKDQALAEAGAAVARLRRERDDALGAIHALDERLLATARDETARRLTQRHRMLAALVAAAAPTAVGGWASVAPSAWQVDGFGRSLVLAAAWVMAVGIALAPRRLGRPPWFRRALPADLVVAYRAATTIAAYNRVAAAHEGRPPRWGRRGPSSAP